MFENIKAIKLSGAIFNTITTLNFFANNKKVALLFGRNGTCKSAIAKAFRKLAGEEIPNIIDAAFIDNSDTAINLDEESKRHIFVFDEDYVDKNVKLQRDHLETIVMLGPAADLAEQISAARANLEEARIIYERQVGVVKEYIGETNIKSPAYHINLIPDALRGDENWEGRNYRHI